MPRSTKVRFSSASQRLHFGSNKSPRVFSVLWLRYNVCRAAVRSGSVHSPMNKSRGPGRLIHAGPVGEGTAVMVGMVGYACRACRGQDGHLVLDLGEQPACDYFPRSDDPGPDPVYPLQMWLCAGCGLAQLVADPTVPEEPRGAEPAALVAQAADAVGRGAAAALLRPGRGEADYGSPHGGSWLDLLAGHGLTPVPDGGQADVILDCFGMMHAADQAAALAERAARLAPGGALLLQYHALDTIVTHGQWNALRHGHYAYYSTTALTAMLARVGLSPRRAWEFELYG